ncbi:MAG: LPS export ABC transporter periplasmic protein LptC [Endomicrobium sp.]|jgi:LPS export ABC transporter protein LptC|nr:LPS export ABC transporter periplasmic protein LptC [Endomicrobium sp.]
MCNIKFDIKYKTKNVCLFIIFVIVFFSYKAKIVCIENNFNKSEHLMKNFSFVKIDKNVVKMLLNSDYAEILSNNIANLKHLKIFFYDKNGKYIATVFANSARVDIVTCNIFCNDKCIIITAKKERFDTINLIYNAKNKMFYSNNVVKVTEKNNSISGIGFESDYRFNKVLIKN